MEHKYTHLKALEVVSQWNAYFMLSHEESQTFQAVFDCFVQLGGEPTDVCFFGDFFQDNYELPEEFIEEYGTLEEQGEEDEQYDNWKDYCCEHNEKLLTAICDRFGVTQEFKIDDDDTEVIVCTPALEHIAGSTRVYPACNHDAEDEDADHNYEEKTKLEAIEDAVNKILEIDRKESRTPTDLWYRKLAVDTIRELDN